MLQLSSAPQCGKLTILQIVHEPHKTHHHLIHTVNVGTMSTDVLNLNKAQFLSHFNIKIIVSTSSNTVFWNLVNGPMCPWAGYIPCWIPLDQQGIVKWVLEVANPKAYGCQFYNVNEKNRLGFWQTRQYMAYLRRQLI